MNKRIIIIADSMAMPRKEVPYEKTWIYLLKQNFISYDIIDKSARGSTSFRLVSEGGLGVDLLENYNPAIVILQLGITECSPRLFKKNGMEYFFMNKILSFELRQKYIKFIKKRRVRNPKLTDISPSLFEKNILNYFDRAKKINSKIIVILINNASNKFISKSPFIQKNIDHYNNIFKRVSENFSNVETIRSFSNDVDINNFCIDELHINSEGNQLIFNKLKSIINKIKI